MVSPISRRSFLTLSVGVAALSLAQACAPSIPTQPAATSAPKVAAPTAAKPAADPKPAPAAAQIKRGGELIHAAQWTYPGLDAQLSSTPVGGETLLFDTLLRYELVDEASGRSELRPGLAERWEQPDPKTVVLHLRKGVTFHDGSDLTAEVVSWNLLRMRDHEKSFAKTQVASLGSVDIVDGSTVKLNLKAPNPAILRLLSGGASSAVGIVSKAQVEKLGDDEFARNPSGTGPMRFKQWITDDRLILERNPDYWLNGQDGKPLPYVDRFVGRYIPDPSVALVDLGAGALSVLDRVPPKDVAQIKANPDLTYLELPWAGPTFFTVGFNTAQPPFDDVRVRQAALHGIDREGMAKVMGFGLARPLDYPWWRPGMLGYDESVPRYPYDPAKVKELLAAAGHPNGIDITLRVIAREPESTIGEFAQNMWTNVGIRTRLEGLERLAWIDALKAGSFQAAFWQFLGVVVDPDFLLRNIACGAAANWTQFCDRDVDRYMAEGAQTLDEGQRHQSYLQAHRRLQEQAYVGSGYTVPKNFGLDKNVRGVGFQLHWLDMNRIWLE